MMIVPVTNNNEKIDSINFWLSEIYIYGSKSLCMNPVHLDPAAPRQRQRQRDWILVLYEEPSLTAMKRF